MDDRFTAFPGKVDTGFPKGNAANIEAGAMSAHGPGDFMVNLVGKRSSAPIPKFASLGDILWCELRNPKVH